MKILLTGGDGYIGKSIYEYFGNIYDIVKITRRDIDLTDSKLVFHYLKVNNFDLVINTAAIGGNRFQPDNKCVLDQNLKIFYNFQLYYLLV